METLTKLTGEERTLWPWEEVGVSRAEYQRSLEGVRRFIEAVDVGQLSTLEDLSAVASLVGHDVRALVAAKAEQIDNEFAEPEPAALEPLRRIERHYLFKSVKWMNGREELEVVVTTGNDQTVISVNRFIGMPRRYPSLELRVGLPSERDIATGERPNVDEHSLYAIDLRGAKSREYHPTREPACHEIQQGFAQLLKDVLSIVRETICEFT